MHAAGDTIALATTLKAGGSVASTLGATAEQVGREDATVEKLARCRPARHAGTGTLARMS